MLLGDVILSAILLTWACAASKHAKKPLLSILCACAAMGVGVQFVFQCSGIDALPPLALQAALVAIAGVLWQLSRLRQWSFIPLGCGATLLAYGIVGYSAWQDIQRQLGSLRAHFPFESLEDRLPPRSASLTSPLPDLASHRLAEWEAHLEKAYREGGYRIKNLQDLHEHALKLFINSPGFGADRMSRYSFPDNYELPRMVLTPTLPQPGVRLSAASLASSVESPMAPAAREELHKGLWDTHGSSLTDFGRLDTFGLFKDIEHVAGFQPHHFSKTPQLEHWQLQTIDLVGLVLHEQPAVYISEHLPSMAELRGSATRPADTFEALGLKVLQSGEDLFVRAGADGGRALGSIRSASQCLPCHGGQRGDLLGAFSYTFIRERPQQAQAAVPVAAK